MNPRVLVIIVTYNGMAHIDRCLQSFDHADRQLQVMIVDNASTDGTPEYVKANYPYVLLVESRRNLGFGAANNVGLRYAIDNNFDFAYLLNQDAWIEHEDLKKLIDVANRHPDYGILSPLQVYAGKKKLDKAFSKTVDIELKNDLLLNPREVKEVYEVGPNRLIQAAHWLIKCGVVSKVGGFSPVFYHYGEDNDYCNRLFFYGYKKGIVPAVLGVHNREGREIYTDSLNHLATKWRHFLCNPNSDTKSAIKRIIKSAMQEFGYFGIKLVKPMWSVVRSYRRCILAKKQSMMPQAFLDNTKIEI